MASEKWPRLNLKINPGENFYNFVNDTWMKAHRIPNWRSRFSVSDEITEKNDKNILELLRELIKVNKIPTNPVTPRQHLQHLVYILKNSSFKTEETFLQVYIHELLSFKQNGDIAKFLGWMLRSSIPTILDLVRLKEYDPPFLIRLTLSPGRLILPRQYYLKPELKKTDVWKAYEEYMSICSIELGLPFLHKAIEAEEQIAKILSSSSYHFSESKPGKKWKSLFSEFDLESFMHGLSIDAGWERRIWCINSSDTFKRILHWLYSSDHELVLSILTMHIIKFASPFLRTSIKEAHFNVFGKALMGVKEMPSPELEMLYHIKDVFPDALCKLYSSKFHDNKTLANIKSMVNKIQLSAIDYMENSDFFGKSTKKKVIEKLHRMKFIIGHPESCKIPDIKYISDSALHSIITINTQRSKQLPSLSGKTNDRELSNYPCFITNASNFLEANTIILPWGELKEPLYSYDSEFGWNYGAIGATIGHEICHAFDLGGSMFSPVGRYKRWWTRKNYMKFRVQTRKVVAFYNKFKHFGKKLNGKNTFSENWADLGGLRISLNSLKKELQEKEATNSETIQAYRTFFISYAFSWSALIRKKTLLFNMHENEHSFGEDRVNRIVPQFQEWIDAFDIKKTDPLYLEPAKRLKFF
jgi:predicted metalloendopeptidase